MNQAMCSKIRVAISFAIAVGTSASMASAQASDSLLVSASRRSTDTLYVSDSARGAARLRARYLLPVPVAGSLQTYYRAVPAITILSPSGYGAEAGEVFGGVGFQNRTPYTHQVDGVAAVGFGLGSARHTLGFETDLISYGTVRSGFGRHVAASFKISRLLSETAGIAAGWDNAIHSSGIDGDQSIYLSASNVFAIRHNPAAAFGQMAVTVGAGSGRFYKEATYTNDKNGVGVFGGISVRVAQPVSAIADWSGQNLTLAVSLAPFARFPLVITPGVTDITRNSGDGARFIVGVGSGTRIKRLAKLLGGRVEDYEN